MVSRKMSFRSAVGSASITLLACSTSSSPSGYLRWISSWSCASNFSARATFAGSPEMRKTFPRCPIWTPNLCSISLRFSLRPPASALAPSLSSSSRRADGSAIYPHRPVSGPFTDLIKRGQQYKPLWRPSVVVGLFVGVAKVLLRHHLSFHQLLQRLGVLAVLDAVQFQRAFEWDQLIVRDETSHGPAPRQVFGVRRAEVRRHPADEDQGRGKERQRQRQPDEHSRPGQLAPALLEPLRQRCRPARGRNGPEEPPLDQLVEALERLELAQAAGV